MGITYDVHRRRSLLLNRDSRSYASPIWEARSSHASSSLLKQRVPHRGRVLILRLSKLSECWVKANFNEVNYSTGDQLKVPLCYCGATPVRCCFFSLFLFQSCQFSRD